MARIGAPTNASLQVEGGRPPLHIETTMAGFFRSKAAEALQKAARIRTAQDQQQAILHADVEWRGQQLSESQLRVEYNQLDDLANRLSQQEPGAKEEALAWIVDERARLARQLNEMDHQLAAPLPDDLEYAATTEAMRQYTSGAELLTQQPARLPLAEEALAKTHAEAESRLQGTKRHQLETRRAATHEDWQAYDIYVDFLGKE